MSKHNPTAEQIAVRDCNPRPGDVIAVTAFAGTGKTTCLTMFAEAHPEARILYLAYNRAMKEDAVKRFPSNTDCKTTHQICWRAFGAKYQQAGKLGDMKKKQIADIMPADVNKFGHKWENIKAIDQTLKNFMYSDSSRIVRAHVPSWVEYTPKGADKKPSLSPEEVVRYAEYLWEEMQNTYNFSTMMPHDGYLKLFQLSKPRLDYDIILFDECQDSNGATLSIVMNQSDHAGIICVGDPYQQMYAFRGSVDAFGLIPATEKLSLTNSFRFGEQTAKIATNMLSEMFGEQSVIHGMGPNTEVMDLRSPGERDEDGGDTSQTKGAVIIARTNGKLLQRALRARAEGETYGFAGGFNKQTFWMLQAVYNLRYGKFVSHDFISLFSDFDDLQTYATDSGEVELLSIIQLLNTHGTPILEKIKDMMDNETPFNKAEVKLTTAHKSKGLEFSVVYMADDFVPKERKGKDGESVVVFGADEANILYVTLTRGVNKVMISSDLAKFMEERNIL